MTGIPKCQIIRGLLSQYSVLFSLNPGPGIPHQQPVPLSVPIPPILNSGNASYPSSPSLSPQLPLLSLTNTLLPTQLRLAQIVELLHTASLLHDDVIDSSTPLLYGVSALRRGAPSAPAAFGNKPLGTGRKFCLGTSLSCSSLVRWRRSHWTDSKCHFKSSGGWDIAGERS